MLVLGNLTVQQSNFFSSEAFLNQGAPYIAAVLAYAIGNQTIAQRLFAVRETLIKPTFIPSTIGYGAMVNGVGMRGVLALSLALRSEEHTSERPSLLRISYPVFC